jgi:hypothetical protein
MREEHDRALRQQLVTLYREKANPPLADELVKQILEQNEIVYAVWIDRSKLCEIDYLVIIGEDLLADRSHLRAGRPMDVVPCLSKDDAERMRHMDGSATQFLSINSGGVVKLADGTFWRAAIDGLPRVSAWPKGASVIVSEGGNPNPLWSHLLRNLDNGESAAILPTTVQY